MAPPTLEEAATLFPGYEVIRLLGRGGMGAVFQARQIELDRMVAIKLLPEAHLGFMLSNGEGVETADLYQAFEHFKTAADKGDGGGKFGLGECYRKGLGVAKDARLAVKYLQEAVDARDARAMNELGDCYIHGDVGLKVDPGAAFKLFSRAVELGNVEAKGNLGALYMTGEGMAANPATGAQLFAEGANAGDSYCMGFYARCLESGIGVTKDANQAKEWYRKAAEAGNEKALAWCKEHKIAVSPGK